MKLFGRVPEGEALAGTLFSWYHAPGWFRLVFYPGRWYVCVRVRLQPQPLNILLTRAWEIDDPNWLSNPRPKAWMHRDYLLRA